MTDFAGSDLGLALDRVDVETYLDREGVDYRPSYGTKGLQLNLTECPVCGEGGRKTYINADTGLGNCFHGSCGAKFNKFKLIRAISGLSGQALNDHIKEVAKEQGWLPKTRRPRMKPAGDLVLPTKCVSLPIAGQNLLYLQNRGVSIQSCEDFSLHYCNKGWWGYKLEDGTEKFVNYDGRIIIPILDFDGRMVSFQGRDITGTKMPKYLFPNGFAVAGSYIYNANTFEEGLHDQVVIGEGAFDAIAIQQALSSDPSLSRVLAVATFGMHLSGGPDGQIEKFRLLKNRGLKVVTFMWDGESRALIQAVKAGLLLRGIGLTVRVAILKKGYDPAQGPGGELTPSKMVLDAYMGAAVLDKLSAVKIACSIK